MLQPGPRGDGHGGGLAGLGVRITPQAIAAFSGAKHIPTERNLLQRCQQAEPTEMPLCKVLPAARTAGPPRLGAALGRQKPAALVPSAPTARVVRCRQKQTTRIPGTANPARTAAQHRPKPDIGPEHPALAPGLPLTADLVASAPVERLRALCPGLRACPRPPALAGDLPRRVLPVCISSQNQGSITFSKPFPSIRHPGFFQLRSCETEGCLEPSQRQGNHHFKVLQRSL